MQKSLMPKGVDHQDAMYDLIRAFRVQKSLMPKGVDHCRISNIFPAYLRAKIFDAERR